MLIYYINKISREILNIEIDQKKEKNKHDFLENVVVGFKYSHVYIRNMSKDDPTVQTTITLRKTQYDIALSRVGRGEAKNVSQVVGKALDYIESNQVEFVEAP